MSESRQFWTAIGEVSQSAARLEVAVGIVTWGLAGLEQPTARVVVPNNMSRMLDIIRDLAPERIGEDALREEVVAWTRRVQAAYSQRGTVIHSVWLGDGGEGPHRAGDLKPMKRDPLIRTANDLRALALELLELASAEAAFIVRLADDVGGDHWSISYGNTEPVS